MAATFSVDGESITADVSPDASLLAALRSSGYSDVKLACGRGECGACTVQVNGVPVMSCVMLAAAVSGDVTTSRSVAGSEPDLVEAFADNHAFQCGFCTPGQVVRAQALLAANPEPTRAEAASGMSGNICRCTGYVQIIDAICSVAQQRSQNRSEQ